MKLIHWLILCAVVSCKTSPSDSQNNAVENVQQEVQTIFVLSGGFNSCPNEGKLDAALRASKTTEAFSLFNDLGFSKVIETKRKLSPILFFTCYTGPSRLIGTDLTKKIEGRFAWNQAELDPLTKQGISRFEVSQGETLNSVSFLTDVKSELQKEVMEIERSGKQVEMYFIGHSYGGFTVIQLADYFQNNLIGMVTIDPISMMECQAKDMVLNPVDVVTHKLEGCIRFPNDKFSEDSSNRVLAVISESNSKKWWFHYYQDKFTYLHSSALPLDKFKKFPQTFYFDQFSNPITGGAYHSAMGRSEILWKDIYTRFVNFQ